MIESGIRETAPVPAPEPPRRRRRRRRRRRSPCQRCRPSRLNRQPAPAPEAPPIVPIEPAPLRAAARKPIDPSLPPDHPLEPGSGRSRPTASAADRIAASEAAVSSTKPPVIADPGPKPNFIAAARRAAQAAAAAAPSAETAQRRGSARTNPRQRTRPLIIAGAAALIVHRLHPDRVAAVRSRTPSSVLAAPAEEVQPEKSAQPEKAPPPVTALPEPTAAAVRAAGARAAASARPPRRRRFPFRARRRLRCPYRSRTRNPAPISAPSRRSRPPPVTARGTQSRPWPPPPTSPAALPRPATPLGDKLPASDRRTGAARRRALRRCGRRLRGRRRALPRATACRAAASQAAPWLERAAKQGLAPAQFRLGGFYEKGIGVKKDLAAARDLYLAAAGKGNGKAMHNLAVLYAEGVDGPAGLRQRRALVPRGRRSRRHRQPIQSRHPVRARHRRDDRITPRSYKWFALAAIRATRKRRRRATRSPRTSTSNRSPPRGLR